MPDNFPVNAGLIQDELLGELALASEGLKASSPATLQALSSIVEATVLHNVVYYQPVKTVTPSGDFDLAAFIENEPLVRELARADVLRILPEDDAKAAVVKNCGEDAWGQLMTDFFWQPNKFLTRDSTGQRDHYICLSWLVNECPAIFESKKLTHFNNEGQDVPIVGAAATLVSQGMPIENLIVFEGFNHKASALVDLARYLNLNLYVVDMFVPHQLGLNEGHNTKTRELYAKILKKAMTLEQDSDVGRTDYASVRLPPLAQLALQRCNGDLTALANEVLDLREEHASFRRQMTDFERAWIAASTRRERIKLQADFQNALDELVKREARPRERLIYKLWDVFKKPADILANLGDKFADRGRSEQVIGQMRGLRKFWTDLLDAPVAEDDERLVATTFRKLAGRDVWNAGRDFAGAMRRRVRLE